MRVADLEGALLDYWVAKAEGDRLVRIIGAEEHERCETRFGEKWSWNRFMPSRAWMDGGPILARMIESGEFCIWESGGIITMRNYDAECTPCKQPMDWDQPEITGEGPTLLIAAMRAYVASKYGDEVPDEIDRKVRQAPSFTAGKESTDGNAVL
jgi:hypothetical protein